VSDVPPDEGTPPVLPADPVEAEDPLAADKRTMVIGGAAMVALILVGVVSAQLFARGGCVAVADPRPVTAATADGAPADLVGDLLGTDGAAIVAAIERAAGVPVTTASAVGQAEDLLTLDEGLVAAGPTVTSFDASLTPVATFDTTDRVVGDGPTVYDVAVANDATGQADALVPLAGADLDVGTCVDTAVVGSPFAFLLGAGDGQLLLLRADEDGDRPELQLRDDETGAVWDARIVLPTGPPGTLAERTSAGLGPDAVVAARRVGPQEQTDSPAVTVHDRTDGTERFSVDATDLAAASGLDETLPLRWQVGAVGETTALLHGRPDPSDADEDAPVVADGVLVVLALADGEVTAVVDGVGPLVTALPDPRTSGDRYAVATASADGADELRLVTADGESEPLTVRVADTHLAWLGDGLLVAGGDQLVHTTGPAGETAAEDLAGAVVADLVTTADGRVAVLLRAGPDGEGPTSDRDGPSVLVVTTRTGDLVSVPATSDGG
jgi:hypothetical protein